MNSSRRNFLETLAVGSAMGLAGCAANNSGVGGASGSSDSRPLRAAFSNAGLQSTWCELGKKTAELWGRLLNVEIEWFDGEFDPAKQRDKIDSITNRDFDFCCFQAVQIDSLAQPCQRLNERGIPVISMDTLLVSMEKMRSTGVWCEVMPDHIDMAEKSVGYLMKKISGKGKVIHIGGLDGHSGAQGRRQGFENILKQYPEVEVVGGGVRWCDWKKEKARNTFEALLQQETSPIAGAFFHSDDMALASIPALKGTVHEKMIVVAVDGQKDGLEAIKAGVLAASAVNPVCRIHQTALFVGQFIARNKEKIDTVPLEIITPGPLVTMDDPRVLEAMNYLADPFHCMV